MSDPKSPDDPSRPPIADAASLFDSRVIYTYKPPESSEPASASPKPAQANDLDEYGLDLAHASPDEKPRATPRVVKPAKPARPKVAAPDRDFKPSGEVEAVSSPKSPTPSDSTIRAERQSAHIDPESDSSDRAPSRSKRRSSERAIGFEEADEGEAYVETESGEVDQVWSRNAEWGPDLVRVGAVALGTLVLAWFLPGSISSTLLILAVGGAACVLLSYPILISIERPIRITPEQAVNDFFAAASHHLPHYRRMWLLVSQTGRESGQFSRYDEFKSHWEGRMANWKQGRSGRFTPLAFQISDFKGDKSVGHTTSHVEYTVRIFVRNHEAEKPIATYRMAHGLVKGSDRMWYLNQATLLSSGR